MSGIGNLADWSDTPTALPCEFMDSLDDMSAPTGLDAPLSNCSALSFARAPSDSTSNKMVDADDMDYLYQVMLSTAAERLLGELDNLLLFVKVW
jgi:hypothetical protein